MILNVGSGFIKDPDEIGIDINFKTRPDIFMSGEFLGFRSEIFDCVRSEQVLEHTTNPFKLLKEVYRVIKFQSTFELSIPNIMTLKAFLRWTFKGRISVTRDHFYGWRISEITNILTGTGFDPYVHFFETKDRFHKLGFFERQLKKIINRIVDHNLVIWSVKNEI